MVKSQVRSDGFANMFSKYIRLAQTDFNKFWLFDRNCMWLELSQFSNKFTEGNARKLAVNFTDLVTLMSQKRDSDFTHHTSAQLARGPKTLSDALVTRIGTTTLYHVLAILCGNK